MGNDDNIDPYDGIDLGVYRYAVAKLLRLLIQARLIHEPEFLSPDDRRRWEIETVKVGSRSIESYLLEAVRANDILYNTVLGPGITMGIAEGDPRSRLKETVISQVTSIWSQSDQWIAKARNGEQIDWDEIILIGEVREIRDGLDSLPHPARKTAGDANHNECPIRMGDKNKLEVFVNGKSKTLTSARYNVIEAVVSAFPGTLSKDQIVTKSGHGDAVNMLKAIVGIDDDWKFAIKLAGSTGGGYGVQRPSMQN